MILGSVGEMRLAVWRSEMACWISSGSSVERVMSVEALFFQNDGL